MRLEVGRLKGGRLREIFPQWSSGKVKDIITIGKSDDIYFTDVD